MKSFASIARQGLAGLALLAMTIGLVVPAQAQAPTREAPSSFADLAERLLPAVVNISTTQTMRNPERAPEMPQFPPGSPFEDFFKEFFDRQGRPDAPPRRATSLGSGFIVDPDGYVVTNNHVIADADEITVILHDNTALKATIVGRDAKTDVALLKVTPNTKLPAVPWGNSDETRIGDWVLAIGNPFGLGGSVTAGIVSARARDINAGPYDDFIQTDASINRGNSGGPLFNMRGEVIGINTAIFSPSGGSIGIGFAIPSSMAKQVATDLRQHGKTRRGWLGVRIQSLNEELAETLGLKEHSGALVASVTPNGPAAKAGIKAGDVILKFDGKDINEMRRLPRIVAETQIGRSVPVELWRDGKRMTVQAVTGLLEEEAEAADAKAQPQQKAPPKEQGLTAVPPLGLSVAPISPALRERFDIADQTRGIVVVEVQPDGPGAEKGMRPGDVIVELAQEEVKSPADLLAKVEAARKANRRSVLMLVESEGGLRFVAIRLSDPAAPKPPAKK